MYLYHSTFTCKLFKTLRSCVYMSTAILFLCQQQEQFPYVVLLHRRFDSVVQRLICHTNSLLVYLQDIKNDAIICCSVHHGCSISISSSSWSLPGRALLGTITFCGLPGLHFSLLGGGGIENAGVTMWWTISLQKRNLQSHSTYVTHGVNCTQASSFVSLGLFFQQNIF